MKQRQIRSGEDKLHMHKHEKKTYWILKPLYLDLVTDAAQENHP